jgi:AcrR family transcriptional regulator
MLCNGCYLNETALPPRTRYTRPLILDAALALTRAEGIDALSARSVAGALGCSTAPIFTHFASMEALHEAVLDAAIDHFVAAIEGPAQAEDPDPLFAAGLGWLRFAAEEPRLYEALFLSHHAWHFKWGPVRRAMAARMGAHPRYAPLSERARFGLVGRASVIVHGLGVEVWSGRLPDASPETLRRLLEQLAGPMIDAAISRGWTSDIHSPELSP